jgi:predicted kinase
MISPEGRWKAFSIPLSAAVRHLIDASRDGDTSTMISAKRLLEKISGQAGDRGAEVLHRLPSVDNWFNGTDQVALDTLVAFATIETARLGARQVQAEHLVLALANVAASEAVPSRGVVDLASARAELQAMIGESAGRAYRQRSASPRKHADRAVFAIVLTGLPGTGKSTLAETLAGRLGIPAFSLDWQLGMLTPFGLVRSDNAAPLADHVMLATMARQIHLGVSVVLDTAGHRRATREQWRRVTDSVGARLIAVQCICPDETVHRARVIGRRRGIPGWPSTVSWNHVQRMRRLWEPWPEPHLILDTTRPIDDCVQRVLKELKHPD